MGVAGKQSKLKGSFESAQACLTLEAMRLGVVPSADLAAYTVGRQVETELVATDLRQAAEAGGAVRAFLGDYGAGKTHLLELIQTQALASGFLTSRVTLDARETTPSHPKRIYRDLVRSLRYPDDPHRAALGLTPLLSKGAHSSSVAERFDLDGGTLPLAERVTSGAHVYLTPALKYVRALSPASDPSGDAALRLVTDWIEGHPTLSNQVIDRALARTIGRHDKIYSLKDYRPWARIYGYLLNGVATLARQVGYSGLVVLVDEAEFYSLLSKDNRHYAETVFKALTWAAVGSRGDGESLPFDGADLSLGGYGLLQRLPPAYDAHAGLYTVFAMTPNRDGIGVLNAVVPADQTTELSPLDRKSYIDLSRRVCDFYASSRDDWVLPEALVAPLGKVISGLTSSGVIENPRQAVKFIIDFIDVMRYRPDRVAAVVRDLQDRLSW